MKSNITQEIELPNGITATLTGTKLTIKGPKGEVEKHLRDPSITILTNKNITLTANSGTRRQKRMINTFHAHIANMIKGVQQPYQYKLKICSGHFPMNVSISQDKLIIKNFLGEKNPRTLHIKKGATVKITGDQIIVESCDKEIAGNVASDIELITSKAHRDVRVFQDGIYLIEKAGEPV